MDNAVVESFFKSECFYLKKFDSVTELRQAVDRYIGYYNNERFKLKLKAQSSVEYRTRASAAA